MLRVIHAVVASLLLGLSALAVAWGIGDLGVVPVREALASQRQLRAAGGVVFPPRAFERLRAARALDPLDADHSGHLAALYAWAALAHPVASDAARAYRAGGIAYLREALRRRPTWGRAWASLAELEALDERPFDETWAHAERALDLAPWDPAVHAKVLWIGFARWERLDAQARGRVDDALARTMQLPFVGDSIVALAVHYGREDRVERLLGRRAVRRAVERARRAASTPQR